MSEVYWYSDATHEEVRNGIAISCEDYTTKYTLEDEDVGLVDNYTQLKSGDEYIYQSHMQEVS